MNEASPIVYVVDDDALFLKAIGRLLKAEGYDVRTFPSAEDFLTKAVNPAGCVVADLRMPGMDGLELQEALTRETIALPIIFLSGEGDIPHTVKAMRQGAEDFLTKTGPKELLFQAIDRAFERNARQRVEHTHMHALQTRLNSLTPRELEVLLQVLDGKLNKQIAALLGITERTVKFHRTAITSKLQVRSVAELTRFAIAAKLINEQSSTFPKG